MLPERCPSRNRVLARLRLLQALAEAQVRKRPDLDVLTTKPRALACEADRIVETT